MDRHFAFVVMSYSGTAADVVWDQAIRPAIEQLGFDAIRVDETHFTRRVTDEIAARIRGAYFVVAEMSHQRPNCYYEVGYAHALGRPTILLVDNVAKVHFDVAGFNCVTYASPQECREKLCERIIGAILTTQPWPEEDDLRNGKFGRRAVANGRLLTARVTGIKGTQTVIELSVRPLPGAEPLFGPVTFYLHDSYERTSRTVRPRNGSVSWEIDAMSAFTVGAKADDGATLLELDLEMIPGANPRFYQR